MRLQLDVVNLAEATFDCSFGRGCDGKCCRNGRPPVPANEARTIRRVLKRALPLLTDRARRLVRRVGFLSRRIKDGHPMLRVIDGWCVFFNQGCVLHKLGAEDGDPFLYKPSACSLFPLEEDRQGRWFVRQWGFHGESWDLFCLNPENSTRPASESLAAELKFARQLVRRATTSHPAMTD